MRQLLRLTGVRMHYESFCVPRMLLSLLFHRRQVRNQKENSLTGYFKNYKQQIKERALSFKWQEAYRSKEHSQI